MTRVGVEIEFCGSRAEVLRVLTEGGLCNGQEYSYSGQAPAPYWTVKSDASVMSGGELVSPIIDFDNEAARATITKACELLQVAGATPHSSAGIHVHVDGTDLTARQVASVVRVFAKFEDVIYRLASSGWERMRPSTHYFAPYTDAKYKRFAAARTEATLMAALYGGSTDRQAYRRTSHGDDARYAGLNVHSWFYRKTLEFRVFNSSVNPERVQGYVAMCVAMVQDARNGKVRSINKVYRLGGMADGSTNADAALHRFLQVMRYEAGMSPLDMKRIRKIWKDSRPQRDIMERVA